MAENGSKWQIGFWIITGGLILLSGGVIANDRLRASEDQRIECVAKAECAKVEIKAEAYRTERIVQFQEIIQRLVRLETKIDGIK